jgi:heptosyltransferase III
LKKTKKIIIIIQRSNGDVFLSSSLIKTLYENYDHPQIDLLINDDTLPTAKLIPYIDNIHVFSYQKKKENRWEQEKNIVLKLFKKYDLSINLTASDRSVFYALTLGKKSISAVEKENKKSWWKKLFLTHYYLFDNTRHILKNNLEPLNILKIDFESIHYPINVSNQAAFNIKKKLEIRKINEFIIFHASTQYQYKTYPKKLRHKLLSSLNHLGIPIIVTGGNNLIDLDIKKQLPFFTNVINFIGETSLEEYIELSRLSLCYIGMDTLNMHIAASQNKRIFAIFGPTNLKMWSPWSNQLQISAKIDQPIQTYGNVTIFQADMPCVACGKAGCNNDFANSDCLDNISPIIIFDEVFKWYESGRF